MFGRDGQKQTGEERERKGESKAHFSWKEEIIKREGRDGDDRKSFEMYLYLFSNENKLEEHV